VREVIQIYNGLGIRQEVEAQIARLHAEAAAHLDAVHKDDADKATLRQIANSLLDRNH